MFGIPFFSKDDGHHNAICILAEFRLQAFLLSVQFPELWMRNDEVRKGITRSGNARYLSHLVTLSE
jgi:hypothetical protein